MKLFSTAVLIAATTASPIFAATVFTEDWDDSLGSTRWSAPIISLETPAIGFDGSVDYAFDYSTIGATSAPGSAGGTTIGVAMETNTTDNCPGITGCTDEGEGVAIVPNGFVLPAGDYAFTADVYLFWNGSGGSTEYAGLGVHTNTTSGAPVRFNINTPDGLGWQVDSDGDSSQDIYRYEGPGGQFGLGGYEAIPDGSIPGVVTGPSKIGPFNQWVELSIVNTGGTVSFAMNGFVIDTFDNTGGTFSGGSIMLNASDPFNSVNVDDIFGFSNLQVFDNIRVEELAALIDGDLNLDGFVGVDDLNIVLLNWNQNVTPGDLGTGDPTGDGFVGVDDLNVVLINWNNGTPPAGGAAIPEPASLALLGMGGVAMLRRRR